MMRFTKEEYLDIYNFLKEFNESSAYLIKMADQDRKDKLGDRFDTAILIRNSFDNYKPNTKYNPAENDHTFETCIQNAKIEFNLIEVIIPEKTLFQKIASFFRTK